MFNTSNTRLAAALKTMGFTLVTWDAIAEHQIMFQFEDNVILGKNGYNYGQLWRDEQWHRFNTNHPFHHIVTVAEARDWIINRVIHDKYQEVGGESDDNYYVYDINIAACVIAAGYYLLRFTDRRFYFIADVEKIHKGYADPERETPLWWQRSYLNTLKVLMGFVPRQKNVLDKAPSTA